MKRLYQKIYLTIIASLLLVVLVAGAVWRMGVDRMPSAQAFEMAGELAAAVRSDPAPVLAALDRVRSLLVEAGQRAAARRRSGQQLAPAPTAS